MQINLEKIKIKYIFFIAIIILLIPNIIRYSQGNILIGEESYYHARISQSLINGEFYDELSYQGRDIIFDPYHILLALFSYIFGTDFSSRLLPWVLGLLSIILFHIILKQIISLEKNKLILLILILSPIFIYTFTVSNAFSFFIFLNLLGFVLLSKEKKNKKKYIYFILSLLPFLIIIFFGLFEAFLSALLLLAYYMYKKDNKILIILLVIAIISSFYYINIANNNQGEIPNFIEKDIIRDSISELGALIGFSILNILLNLIGLFLSWKYKKKIVMIYFIILLLIVSYYYIGASVNIYLNFIFAVFAGLAFHRLLKLNWEINLIKNLTLIIIIVGLFLSAINYIGTISNSQPDKDIIVALEYLQNLKEDNVLSHYKNGYWINYYGKKSVMDANFYFAPDVNKRFSDSNAIFKSNNLKDTKRLLDKYDINYIFITPKMKTKLDEKKGLLFLFTNKETFNNIYNWNGVEIWEYRK